MSKKTSSSGFNINDLVQEGGNKPKGKAAGKPPAKKKKPSGGGADPIGQPTPPMPSGMGMGMGMGGY